MPEKLARSVVVTPCCRHHSLTERPLLRHSWICAAHSCSSARCFNSALVILTPHNTTVAKPFATFRYYCLMCVYARLGLTVTLLARSPPRKVWTLRRFSKTAQGQIRATPLHLLWRMQHLLRHPRRRSRLRSQLNRRLHQILPQCLLQHPRSLKRLRHLHPNLPLPRLRKSPHPSSRR